MENVFVTTDKVNKTVCQHNSTVLLKSTMDLVLQIHADVIHKSNIFFNAPCIRCLKFIYNYTCVIVCAISII